jgi:SAM-dependent methyltransferase
VIKRFPVGFIPQAPSPSLKCPLCLSTEQCLVLLGSRQHLTIARKLRLISDDSGAFRPLEQSLTKCMNCDVCYLMPLPDPIDLDRHYKSSATLHGTADLENYCRRVMAPEEILKSEPLHVLARIEGHYGQHRSSLTNGFIADIGCNAADFLAGFRLLDFKMLLAIEPDAHLQRLNAEYLGCDTHTGMLETIPSKYNSKCSVVSLRDTLEHLVDPISSIQQAWKLLRPGGLLYLKVPNFNCLAAQSNLHVFDWFEVDHLFYFTPSSIKTLLFNCGFDHIHTETLVSQYDEDDFSYLNDGKLISQDDVTALQLNETGRILQAYAIKPFTDQHEIFKCR